MTSNRQITEDEMNLILKGIRPDWVPMDVFRHLRNKSNDYKKTLLRGKFYPNAKEA